MLKVKLFNDTERVSTSAARIEKDLDSSWFVEYLINKFLTQARYKKNMDFEKLNRLLSELEEIRLDLDDQE